MTKTYTLRPKQAILLLACCFFAIHTLSAQKALPSSGFLQEIGLDFSIPLHGDWGGALLYRHRIGTPKLKVWQNAQAIRAVIGFYQNDFAGRNQLSLADSIRTHSFNGTKDAAFIHLGWELRATKKQFRVYGGADLGFHRIKSTSQSLHELSMNGATLESYTSETIIKTYKPQVSVFGGANFFIIKRLSIGVELSLPAALEFDWSKTVSNGTAKTYKNTILAIGGDYAPRLVYVSWHFDGGATKGEVSR